MVTGMAVLGNAPAHAAESADLSVHLAYVGLLGMPGHFDLSVTNHGPDPLQSATVTLHAERLILSAPAPCTFNRTVNTLTCQFGTLPTGATTTARTTPIFILNEGNPTHHLLTLTRVTSTPVDPNPTNDTATKTCTSFDSGSPLQPDLLFC